MNNASCMRRVQSIRDLNRPVELCIQRDWLVTDPVFQRLAFQQFHRNVRRALELSDFVDRANVGVVDSGSGFGLMLEALDCRSVAGYLFRKELQSNFAFKLQVFGAIHHAHAAAAKPLDDAIMRNDLVQHCRKI